MKNDPYGDQKRIWGILINNKFEIKDSLQTTYFGKWIGNLFREFFKEPVGYENCHAKDNQRKKSEDIPEDLFELKRRITEGSVKIIK